MVKFYDANGVMRVEIGDLDARERKAYQLKSDGSVKSLSYADAWIIDGEIYIEYETTADLYFLKGNKYKKDLEVSDLPKPVQMAILCGI